MRIEEFQVRKDELAATRRQTRAAAELAEGEVLAKVDRFALTANNITYGVAGARIGYWKFFPATDGFGIIPVWGFADVAMSRHPEIAAGERLYGYFPTATHLVMRPDRVRPERLIDAAPHRNDLPPVYNRYARIAGEPHDEIAMENERMLLFPLYATSFCIWDFLKDNAWFGAEQIVIASASSKTAIGLAYALKDDEGAPPSVALTSARNLDFVEALALYGSVTAYERVAAIRKVATVIVDMSGAGDVISRLHAHLGDAMKYTSNVGITHYANAGMGPSFIRERSAMFFAPGHIEKRAADWGPGAFEQKAFAFWRDAALKSRDWLKIAQARGMGELDAAYKKLLAGDVDPAAGIVVEMA